jgi:hypothetical protein
MTKDRAQKHKEYDIRRATICCEEWHWNKCMTNALKTSVNENCKTDLQKYLKEHETNITKRKDCKHIAIDSVICEWPLWVYFVLLLFAAILTIAFVLITMYFTSKTSDFQNSDSKEKQETGEKSSAKKPSSEKLASNKNTPNKGSVRTDSTKPLLNMTSILSTSSKK